MAIVSALLTLASCAPQAFLIKPEMRAASKSGLNFNGKSMAVVYITDDDKAKVFNICELCGYGIYGAKAYAENNKYYCRYYRGSSCD